MKEDLVGLDEVEDGQFQRKRETKIVHTCLTRSISKKERKRQRSCILG